MDSVTAMSRLLSDVNLREQFRSQPREVARQLGLVGEDLEHFVRIDVAGLDRQAEALLSKRWHEVAALIPDTIAEADNAQELFQFYATRNWPVGHRRHQEDARDFLQFLQSNGLAKPNLRELRLLNRSCQPNVMEQLRRWFISRRYSSPAGR